MFSHRSHTNRRFSITTLIIVALINLCAFACADVTTDNDDIAVDKLLEGRITNQNPAVGQLFIDDWSCTGTLISPSVVLTAAHCVAFESDARVYGLFVINSTETFVIDGAISFSQDAGELDIALLHLEQSVPNQIVRPIQVADSLPNQRKSVTLYGFGCQDRTTLDGPNAKQKVSFKFGQESSNLCPGDSGGPGIFGPSNKIIFVNSAYYIASGLDLFGKPSLISSELSRAQQLFEQRDVNAAIRGFRNGSNPRPNNPTQFKARVKSDKRVRLSWNSNEDVQNFKIERKKQKQNGKWSRPRQIAQRNGNQTNFTDRPGQGNFQYRVRSLRGGQHSKWSPWKQVQVR